ncbi:hypothetical protein [Phytomonospora endophytica]|uniref:Uncharacterized protein n=1 Tax=Phytomonospora endophytica TaxID=714109 RepID=A0A841G1S8_9ACTN|nr:hypothetical protein [Phytomonospora endophytica]MBB6039878.1 hypothetical protein [Phytomonospora endophytica]GIG71052.1 hypothetical protein Pen01_73470 [Phytomonospora endophytica]
METTPGPLDAQEDHIGPQGHWGWIFLLAMFAVPTLVLVIGMYAANAPEPTTVAATPTSPRPTPAATTTSPSAPMVTVECDGHTARLPIGEKPDFSGIWNAESDYCDADRPAGVPLTDLEQKAFEKSGYDTSSSVQTLYAVCAQADPDGYYTSGAHRGSPEQAAEIRGALVLCPDHPFADELKATAEGGEEDAELEKGGRLFHSGTFLVGEEIQPGTYVVTGDIEDCYWERQDRNGGIIDNYFSASARRVEVTIQASDYAFSSDGCGEWRPA